MKSILITVDVEDWFQVENFKKHIPFSSWDSRELRVEKNTHRLLDLFDSTALHNQQPTTDNPPRKKMRATFFVLGWLAERLPGLVREIQARGHEVASHGYLHNLCNLESKEDLIKDLITSKKLLEDILGSAVVGYRAPSFSVTNDILKMIEDCGYQYDSSYNSFEMHGRYGRLSIEGYPQKGIAYQISQDFHELPISNLKLFRHKNNNSNSVKSTRTSISLPPTTNNKQQTISNNLHRFIFPFGGGGYFRLTPFPIFKQGVKRILNKESAYLFYMHPWEIDPNQPRVKEVPVSFKFRHYTNLAETHKKLQRLILAFNNCRFSTCSEYIKKIQGLQLSVHR
jgi:polysaccharide deacetylase family protein (PEP-CTERM system associated)